MGATQVSAAQVGAAQVGAAQLGIVQVGGDQLGVVQVGSEQVGAAQVGVVQVGAAQVGVAQVGAAQVVGANVGRIASFRQLLVDRLDVVVPFAAASPRTACSGLRLVYGGIRHARSERGEGVADGAGRLINVGIAFDLKSGCARTESAHPRWCAPPRPRCALRCPSCQAACLKALLTPSGSARRFRSQSSEPASLVPLTFPTAFRAACAAGPWTVRSPRTAGFAERSSVA